MTSRTPTYPLRLPASIKNEAERLAAAEGTSLNQFVATAVAEPAVGLGFSPPIHGFVRYDGGLKPTLRY
jgi:hypothetical protein